MARRPKGSSPSCGYALDDDVCTEAGEHLCAPRADHAQAFFEEVCVHTKGDYARRPFTLADWQRDDIVRPLFGRVRWDGERERYVRRYRIAWIELARKNGKSELLAGIALYLLCADGEEGAEIYGAALDRDQARKVFDVAERMVQLSPVLSRRLRIIRHPQRRIIDEKTGSYYETVAADAAGNLGHNPHGIVFDEVLTQRNGGLWASLRTGFGARAQPLMVAATTAGNDPSSWPAQQHAEMERVAEDPDRASHVFVYQRNTPPDADPWDEANWTHANPALGDFLSIQSLRDEALEARNEPAKENEFRQFRLNQWVQQTTRFIPLHLWDTCQGEVAANPTWLDDRLEGEPCVAGLDLSAKFDLTAWCLLFESGWVRWRFWLPEDVIGELDQATGGRVSVWVRQGWIAATEGDVVDYQAVFGGIAEDCRRFSVRLCHYDKWNAEHLRQQVEAEVGLEMLESSNTFQRMTEPLNELLALLKRGDLKHGGNPVARWHADALEVKSPRDDPDRMRPVKPERGSSGKRIDGMAALLHAIEGRLVAETGTPQVHGWPDDLLEGYPA